MLRMYSSHSFERRKSGFTVALLLNPCRGHCWDSWGLAPSPLFLDQDSNTREPFASWCVERIHQEIPTLPVSCQCRGQTSRGLWRNLPSPEETWKSSKGKQKQYLGEIGTQDWAPRWKAVVWSNLARQAWCWKWLNHSHSFVELFVAHKPELCSAKCGSWSWGMGL